MRKEKKGFTLIELVIVIAVIAILAAVLIPTISSVVGKGNQSVVEQESARVRTEILAISDMDLDSYCLEMLRKHYTGFDKEGFAEDTAGSDGVKDGKYDTLTQFDDTIEGHKYIYAQLAGTDSLSYDENDEKILFQDCISDLEGKIKIGFREKAGENLEAFVQYVSNGYTVTITNNGKDSINIKKN